MNSPHLFSRPDQVDGKLYVCTMISNPVRFRTRWKLYQDFARHVEAAGAVLYTAEVAFADREFAITEPDNPRHLQLRTTDELWHKENALNLLIARLPQDWKYVAWIDADVMFARPDWANETIQQLQHYPIVQMWSHAQDLGPNHEMLGLRQSFGYCYTHGLPRTATGSYYEAGGKAYYWHPGYAWAARRETIDALGGLIEHCILGSADYHMAYSLIGEAEITIAREVSDRYKFLIRQWQERSEHYAQRNLGYVPGTLLHYWHGPKASRRYLDRWQILDSTGYDPDLDLKRDWQGLFQLTPRSRELRNQLRAYFRQRDEDATGTDALWAETMLK